MSYPELTPDSIDDAGNAANPTNSVNDADLTNPTPPTSATESAAPPPCHSSWAPNLDSIDSLPHPSTVDLIHATDRPVPIPTNYGQNRALTPANAKHLNTQLRKWGLQGKRLAPPSVADTKKIQAGEEIVEYEITRFKVESRSWVLNRLAVAAEEDKANRHRKERTEQEKAEAETAVVAAAQDDEVDDEEMGEDEASITADIAVLTARWNSKGKSPEGASGQSAQAGVNKEGRKRKGSGPPLGVFYEDVVPAKKSAEWK